MPVTIGSRRPLGHEGCHIRGLAACVSIESRNNAGMKCRVASVAAAFTVPEMLAIVAIIMILLSLLMPSLRHARELARRSICLSNQHQIVVGTISYSNDNLQVLPLVETWATHFVSDNVNGPVNDKRGTYLKILGGGANVDPRVFYCPSHAVLDADNAVAGWNSLNPNRYMSYGPIGIWQQNATSVTWSKHYVALPPLTTPTVARQGNRPIKRSQAIPQIAVVTDSQISWYAGSWGLSFTYPGDGLWPNHPGYYSFYSFPHRTGNNAWAGTNVVYYDGSGQWRHAEDILNRSIAYPHGAKWIMHYNRGIYEGPVYW
jgi:type II secretory pathway pseudopilin PulG